MWRRRVIAMLAQQKLHKVLQGKTKKPEDMSDEDWNYLDLQCHERDHCCRHLVKAGEPLHDKKPD